MTIHRHFARLLLLILAALVMLAGCRPAAPTPNPDANIQIELTVAPDPPTTGEAALTVKVTRNGVPVDDGKINIRGDMNHAGMVPVIHENIPLENGVAEVPFEWTMGGGWFVEVTVTLPDGQTATQKFDYSVTTQ